MLVKIGEFRVDVKDRKCPGRSCYRLGFDKGSFVKGRGYTSYHKNAKGEFIEYPVCATRHLRGCPMISICPLCRRAGVRDPGGICGISLGGPAPCQGVLTPPEGNT